MNIRVTLFLAIFYTIGCVSNLFADTDPTLNDTIPLKEVVVVSTAKTEVNRNQAPLTISVVNRKTIEESTETGVLSILSEQVPGVFVTERGVTGYGINNGSAGTVTIHGVGQGNKVLMLFNGQPMWAGVFGHHIADAYVASDAERVEIIRGPGSLLYGSNAMGGVINVITRKATEDGIHGNGRIMYGSYDTWKFMGSSGYKKDKFNAYVSLNRDQTDGQRDNSAFYINNGYVKLGYEISDNWNVSGNAIIADFKVNNPGANTLPMFENWAKALRSTYSVSVSNKYEKMSGAVQAFYNDGKHKINDGHAATAPAQTAYFMSSDFNYGIALYESFRLIDGNLFTVGVDAKQWGGRAWNEDFNGNETQSLFDDKKVNEFAGYAVVQQTLFDKLTLNAGIRLENNEGYGNEWVPQGGIAYQINNQASLKASASKGFRSPNINDMFSPWGGANPDLKPEEMNNFDVSYLQSLWNNKLQLELTAFYAKGKNMILAPVNWGELNSNSGQFTNKGIDFAVSYQVLPALKLAGNYSYLDSDIKVPAAPKHKAFFNANWAIDKFTVSPSVQYVSDLYLSAYGGYGVPAEAVIPEGYEDYALLNCKVSYKATPYINLFINGENLTDASYRMYNGYPMPGIVVLGGVDFKF
ncbi:ligand-gated channel [Bacteroidia bacterium]|nr:ligand-gated channel [Bacteroidia bacterium]